MRIINCVVYGMLIAFLAFVLLLIIASAVHECVGGKWFCKVFGWHRPSDDCTFDGMSFHSKCKDCGKDIMQDSQGNWF